MPAVRFIAQVRGYNEAGNPVTFDDSDANRVIEFASDLIIEKDTTSVPPRIRVRSRGGSVAALEERVAALEAMLDGSEPIEDALTFTQPATFDRIIVHTIEAKGSGEARDFDTPDLRVVVRDEFTNEYPVWWVVRPLSADVPAGAAMSWFGVTANKQQTVTVGFVVEDVQNRLEAYGLVMEV